MAESKQEARSSKTRARLLSEARRLFGERGYAAVGTEEIVKAAGLTRGALYHQFADKQDLFRAVFEEVEADVTARIGEQIAGSGAASPLDALTEGAELLMDVVTEPDIRQIVAIDGPSVLGWEAWREIIERYGLGLIIAALEAAVEQGEIPEAPVRPMAHLLLGAVDEGAMYVAFAEDPASARTETLEAWRLLLGSLASR
jgi:AcrR family transcriptional regulator